MVKKSLIRLLSTTFMSKRLAENDVKNTSDIMYESHLTPPIRQHELWHDKTNKVTVRPAKTQISLGIRPVRSESSLCAQWVAKDPSFLHADSEDSESLLGAHSFCWFCHVAAHISLHRLVTRTFLLGVQEKNIWYFQSFAEFLQYIS